MSEASTTAFDVRAVEADDLDQYFEVRSQSFGVATTERDEWKEFMTTAPDIAGFGAFRGGLLLGALRVIPGGQFVLGRAVPMGGIAAVVVRPEARGAGIARALLQAAIGWMRDTGLAVSSLHPASTRAYRSAGWEIAGQAGWVSVPTRSFSAIRGDAAGPVVRLDATGTDAAEMRSCYAAVAPAIHGAVDRSPSFWALHERGAAHDGAFAYGVRGLDGLTGYVAYTQTPGESWGYSIRVDDFVAQDRATALALWRFIGGHSMQVERVTVHLSALPLLLHLLDEQDAVVHLENRWMHRIVDVPRALAARGYPAGLEASVDVLVTDPVLADTAWTISVADGTGEASPTTPTDATLRLDIGAFSALSIGGTTVGVLRSAGRLQGPDDAAARLASILGAPAPTMTDDF
jgi:predicted acetyltransferase